ncbi:M28 family peptidase [Desulfosoma caldarium]|uniref:Peptidase M28-like protein n=1 Tax=Desulfosoma caldarium TaxID=610254 RepID=A0A3N1UQ61_9BACT|nr:M28 family peptidase [Desulfosoma caldarium]ROQ90657.1 peptidase M28-like protein [Desulfosoma caldarium]
MGVGHASVGFGLVIVLLWKTMGAAMDRELLIGHSMDLAAVEKALRRHVQVLTVEIGERSVLEPSGHARAARYIAETLQSAGLRVWEEPYPYGPITVANILAETGPENARRRYILGAHYDSLVGTVGADDNASAVAVLLETARTLQALEPTLPVSVQFAAFALEEPPAYGTRSMGSRVRARHAKRVGEHIDGMICLEMVGYTCREPGCQRYPFPLGFMNYPSTGDFIGIVGNFASRFLVRAMERSFKKNPSLPVITLTVPFNGWLIPTVRLSDHAPFWDAGFPAVMVTDSAFYRNPHYHTVHDTMDTLDFAFMARLVQSLVIFLGEPMV